MEAKLNDNRAVIACSDGTKVIVEEKPYGSSFRDSKNFVKTFLFITVKGGGSGELEVFKMYLSEKEEGT